MVSAATPEWRGHRVLVTGATGLLGSAVVEELLSHKADVVVLARDRVPNSLLYTSGNIDRVSAVDGSLEDLALVERALNEYEIETVLHLGAQTIVGTANRSPLSTFESNIRGTYILLEACRRSPLVRAVVVASSDKAYGDQDELPYTEDAPLQGRNPYDVSKSCADLIATSYSATYDLPIVVTRCGNLFGGGDLNWNRIFPGTIRSIVQGERPVIRSDGTYIRDYFYVKDAAKAYLMLAARAGEPGIRGQAFNFSNEVQLTVLDVVKKISELMGSDLEPEILNQAHGEIKHQYLSAEKARSVLGWNSEYEMDAAIKETIHWYQNFLNQA